MRGQLTRRLFLSELVIDIPTNRNYSKTTLTANAPPGRSPLTRLSYHADKQMSRRWNHGKHHETAGGEGLHEGRAGPPRRRHRPRSQGLGGSGTLPRSGQAPADRGRAGLQHRRSFRTRGAEMSRPKKIPDDFSLMARLPIRDLTYRYGVTAATIARWRKAVGIIVPAGAPVGNRNAVGTPDRPQRKKGQDSPEQIRTCLNCTATRCTGKCIKVH